MAIINGKKIAQKINQETKKKIKEKKLRLGLAAILIGNDKASQIYINLKEKIAKSLGIDFYKYHISENTDEKNIIKTIQLLNKNKNINGIIVQLPLPKKFDTEKIIQSVSPEKDIDGFHKDNIKKLLKGKPQIISPLINGVLELIKSTNTKLENKKIVLIGKNKNFITSFKKILEMNRAKPENIKWLKTVSKNTQKTILKADLIIIALGKAKILKKKFVKKNAIVIDIGINKEKNKIIGDADFENLKNHCSFISPVPGGVGPMTIAMLMKNLIKNS